MPGKDNSDPHGIDPQVLMLHGSTIRCPRTF
jgi:hypothetical protein